MCRNAGPGSWKKAARQGATVVFAAGVLVWLSWLLTPRRDPAVPPGGVLAAVTLWTPGGSPGSLERCRAILVVSAECPSCLIAMRLLGSTGAEAGRHGLLVCVSLSPPEETRRMVNEAGVRYRVLFASGPELMARWRISAVPALIVRDAGGRVLDVLSGARCVQRGPAAIAALLRGEGLP